MKTNMYELTRTIHGTDTYLKSRDYCADASFEYLRFSFKGIDGSELGIGISRWDKKSRIRPKGGDRILINLPRKATFSELGEALSHPQIVKDLKRSSFKYLTTPRYPLSRPVECVGAKSGVDHFDDWMKMKSLEFEFKNSCGDRVIISIERINEKNHDNSGANDQVTIELTGTTTLADLKDMVLYPLVADELRESCFKNLLKKN